MIKVFAFIATATAANIDSIVTNTGNIAIQSMPGQITTIGTASFGGDAKVTISGRKLEVASASKFDCSMVTLANIKTLTKTQCEMCGGTYRLPRAGPFPFSPGECMQSPTARSLTDDINTGHVFDEVKRKGAEARLKGEEARLKGEEARRKGEEARLKGEEARRKAEEARRKGEELRRKVNLHSTTTTSRAARTLANFQRTRSATSIEVDVKATNVQECTTLHLFGGWYWNRVLRRCERLSSVEVNVKATTVQECSILRFGWHWNRVLHRCERKMTVSVSAAASRLMRKQALRGSF